MMTEFVTVELPEKPSHIAPDGSEIRALTSFAGKGGMAHCTLLPGQVSEAVTHRTVEEIWYFLQGRGEVYRKQGEREEVTAVYPTLTLTIPLGTHFQFRNTGDEPLCFVIVTMPPWTGKDEAVRVVDYWTPHK
jgi:mannose-6-phosphate isomerase-like protein (cupin superfamily)